MRVSMSGMNLKRIYYFWLKKKLNTKPIKTFLLKLPYYIAEFPFYTLEIIYFILEIIFQTHPANLFRSSQIPESI